MTKSFIHFFQQDNGVLARGAQRADNGGAFLRTNRATMVFHSTPSEHLAKLQRVANRLNQQEMHADDMDDFCKTAWHLIEQVEKSASSSRDAKRAASKLRSDQDIILCQHAANVEKHGVRKAEDEKSPLAGVEVRRGYGIGRYGRGGFGVGEQCISLTFKDGTERDALDFVSAVLAKWEAVFAHS